MHWNLVNIKGEKLVSDIQGVRREKYYELTDPAFQSINQEYGDGDLGCFGLIAFLIRHKHNKYCKDLPWPEESEIKRYFYNITLMEMRRTTFVNELKRIYGGNKEYFSEKYRIIINSVFRPHRVELIATNQWTIKKRCIIF